MMSKLTFILSTISVMMFICKPVACQQQQRNFNKGVIFLYQGDFLLTTNYWTLVADIDFNSYREEINHIWGNIKQLQRIFRNKSKRFQYTGKNFIDPQTYTTEVSKRLPKNQEEQIGIGEELREKTNIFQIMLHRDIMRLKRAIKQMNKDFKEIEQLVIFQGEKQKRGLVDLGGKTLKFLFGVATSDEIQYLNSKVEQIHNFEKEMTHVLEVQISVLNQSVIQTEKNEKAIEIFSRFGRELELEMNESKFTFITESVLKVIETKIIDLKFQIQNLGEAIHCIAIGKLSKFFIREKTLLKILSNVRNKLPAGLSLLIPPLPNQLFKYYQLSEVTTIAVGMKLRLFIKIPLVNQEGYFDLFEIAELPTIIEHTSLFVSYRTYYPYLAVSKDKQSYMLLEEKDMNSCSHDLIRKCSPKLALRKIPFQSCEFSLYLGDEASVKTLCEKHVFVTFNPIFYRGNKPGHWIYSVSKSINVVINCPINSEGKEQIASDNVKISGTGLLVLNNSCTGHVPGYYLSAMFRDRSKIDIDHIIVPQIEKILSVEEKNLLTDVRP